MISIRNLTKSYALGDHRHYVFKDVSFDFPADKNIGILGPNGAGKSTLLRILGGIDHPDSGEVHRNASLSWPLGLRGGFVGHMTGRENCRMVCNAYGVSQKQIKAKVEFIKELSEIGDYFEQPVAYYSTGMGSRLGFALSMAFDFDYFLIDEITAVGDAHFKKLAKEALEQKRKSSKVIMVSHSIGEIKRFCDVAVLIKEGVVTVYEDLNTAIEAYLPKTEHLEGAEDIFKRSASSNSYLETQLNKSISSHSAIKDLIAAHFTALNEALSNNLELDGRAENFLIKISRILIKMQQPKRALKLVDKAIAIDAYRINFRTLRANILRELKRFDDSREAINSGLDLDPKNPYLLNASAHLYFEIGDLDKAEADSHQALKGDSKLFNAWILLSKVKILKEEQLDAFHALEKAEAINPRAPQTYSLKAQLLFNEEAYREGLILTQKAYTTPVLDRTDQDWTNLEQSLLLSLEELNLLKEFA